MKHWEEVVQGLIDYFPKDLNTRPRLSIYTEPSTPTYLGIVELGLAERFFRRRLGPTFIGRVENEL